MTLQTKTSKKRKGASAGPGLDTTTFTPIDVETLPIDRAAAITLIESWLQDSSGYDEEVWPVLQAEIEANRLSRRTRFHD